MAHAHRTARGWLILLSVLLLAFVAAVVWVVISRNTGANVGTATTVSEENGAAQNGDGWFTEDQANRGEEAYAESCASCHGPELEGGTGPALAGDTFWERWEGDTVHTFFEVTSQTMPQDAPGSLEPETYADITAHVLHVNDFPTGEEELPPDEERLSELVIEDPGAGGDDAQPAEGDAEDEAAEGDAEDEAAEGEGAEGDAAEAEGDGVGMGVAETDDAATEDATTEDATTDDAEGEATNDAEADDAEREATDDTATTEDTEEAPADDAEAAEDTDREAAEGDATEETDDREAAGDDEAAWFSAAQVQAGQAVYAEHCARCHGSDFGGDPPLTGGFAEGYGTVWALYQYVSQTMPLDHPGSLRDQQYLDAVAYVLDGNGYPTGGDGDQRRAPVRTVLEEMDLRTERSDQATGDEADAEDAEPADDQADADDGEAADENDGAQDGEGAEATSEDVAEGEDTEDGAAMGVADTNDSEDAGNDASNGEGSDDGYFPQEQADRGQEPYAQHCAQCHGDDLQGQPPLEGEGFLSNHESVWDLFEYTRENMPQGDPGSLDDETYADIVAYVLSENDFPEGGDELGPDREDAMRDMPLDADAADGEGSAEGDQAEGDQAEGDQAEGDQAEGEQADGEAPAPADEADEGAETAEAQDGEGEPTEDEAAGDRDDADTTEADTEEADTAEADTEVGDLPPLGSLEIDASPANMTLNILGPDGLVGRAVGGQTLEDLQPGRYVVAGSRGHQSMTVNVDVASGETATVRIRLDELDRSSDVPEEPAVPSTEVPGIPRQPGDGVLIGATPAAPGTTRPPGVGAGAAAGTADTEFATGRGQQAYAIHCSRCHGAELQGNVAPALAGEVFFERWAGHPVDWFYFQARAAMPPHGAGSLPEQLYADIVVYILTTNGVLEGFESFAPGDDEFRSLVIERGRTADGEPALEEQVDRLRETLHGPQEDDAAMVLGQVLPYEWPDDPGAAPIGRRDRIDAAAATAPIADLEADEEAEAAEPGDAPAEDDAEAADEALTEGDEGGQEENGEGNGEGENGQEEGDGAEDAEEDAVDDAVEDAGPNGAGEEDPEEETPDADPDTEDEGRAVDVDRITFGHRPTGHSGGRA
jgi:mono/diheme cytochrome c family protein